MARILKTDGMKKCIGCFTCMLVCSGLNRQNHSISKSAIRIKTSGGLSGKFVANACIACTGERACAESCPTGALDPRPGGGVILDSKKCISCRKCAKACIVGAVYFDELQNTPIICKHCGACARYCPHECLRMEEVSDDI
ncbi:MAG: [Fe-S]-binding protein [Firmicutes bacterium]|nr:[Fe-S]-binding protein [Bacillota bacterium]